MRLLQPTDYQLGVGLNDSGQQQSRDLLDAAGNPKSDLSDPSEIGLAAFAADTHKHAGKMSDAHLEKIVWWIKSWQMEQSGVRQSRPDGFAFQKLVEALRHTKDYVHDDRRARRSSYKSQLLALGLGVSLTFTLMLVFNNADRIQQLAMTCVSSILIWSIFMFKNTGRDIWKAQERRHLMRCLRIARCTRDLAEIGLFDHVFDGKPHGATDSNKDSAHAMREVQRRLADALYFDLDGHLHDQNR